MCLDIDLKREGLMFLADIKEGEDPIDWAIRRAYIDMSRRTMLFKEGISDEEKADLKECAGNAIRDALEELTKKECVLDQNSFDTWHCKLSNDLCRIYNNSTKLRKAFTCGQAQKWINMALKYLWVFELAGLGTSAQMTMEEIEPVLHIPLDRAMLEKLREECQDIEPPKAGSDGYAWSKIQDYEVYCNYQKAIREEITKKYRSPMAFELKHWNLRGVSKKKGR